MEITDVRVRRLSVDDRMKAIVSITIDNELAIHDIKVIESGGQLFVAMPARKTAKGEHKDIAHPIKSEIRAYLENEILNKYHEEVENRKEEDV